MLSKKSYRLLLPATLIMGLCASPRLVSAAATPTTTTLAITSAGIAVDTVAAGTVVTLTATVTAGGTAVTPGQVNFCDASATYCTDIHIVGTAQLTSAGTAAMKFYPGVGSHSYKAVFLGTHIDAGSSSAVSGLTVIGTFPTTTTIAWSGIPGNYALTATVTGHELASPTGAASFLDASNGYAVLGNAMLLKNQSAVNLLSSKTSDTGTYADGALDSIAVGDLNGDGIPDLVVPNFAGNSLTILLGNGDGTFTPTTASVVMDQGPHDVAVGDFNEDGILDLAVVTQLGSMRVLLGNGDGTFRESEQIWYLADPPYGVLYVAAGDFNGDGHLDIVASSADLSYLSGYSCALEILLGVGDGTFSVDSVPSPLAVSSPVFVVGDFNGDGILDLAVPSVNWVTILLGNGDGTFTPTPASPTMENIPNLIVVGDFNGDSKADLAVTNNSDDGIVAIFLGNGDGTFRPAPNLSVIFEPTAIAVGDFNGDGIADLAVANVNCGVMALLGNGDGTFAGITENTSEILCLYNIVVGDFDRDGISDMAGTSPSYYGPNTGQPPVRDVTVLTTQLTQTASATVTGISPVGSGRHNIYAGYDGDEDYSPSVSASTPLIARQATPTVTVTPSSTAISTVQPLSVTVAVSGGTIDLTPTGSITLTSGSYTSAATALGSGSATINVPAGSLAVGTDTLTASYSGDGNFNATTGTASVTITNPSFMISGTTVTVAPGAVTGNVSTITVMPVGGFTGQVALTAVVTASPAGAQYPPTMSFGSTSPVSITGINPGTATLTISTTANTRAALNHPQDRGVFWYMASGATLACLLFLGIPVRRYSRLRMLGIFAILMAFVGGILACGGRGGNTSTSGTTAGSYTITVTGTSGSTTVTCPFAVTVQ